MVRYSDHYAEQGILTRLMNRLRSIAPDRFAPRGADAAEELSRSA